ncbi:uncharacterized protein GIQ15_05209 [Arthroderma uncinatum]|uniref:uncharacterized protein n=1 Tax=Arthroderma uncinatum TaxID=74035 RepID=UPI00144AB2B3|nr:uncharacterized protein GIQ15_05209 [Arthroderma uncinatum]KAF3482450.1 hypothetical protein GIQ15_05209 [Arthroderma uncinatum]
MNKPRKPLLIGYDAWIGADALKHDTALYSEVIEFVEGISWGALAEICNNLKGTPCTISEKYTVGRSNLVRQIRFIDDQIWVARLRLPRKDGKPASQVEDSIISCAESLTFLRKRTQVPAPEVYHYDPSSNNPVGAPYILMKYVHGTLAKRLQKARGCRKYMFGTPKEDANFRKQLASIQVGLATHKWERIGRPRLHENGGFSIGSLETDLNFATATQYYDHLTKNALWGGASEAPADSQDTMILIPALFKTLIARWSTHSGPYGLVHTGLGAHNVLVNEKFEVLALIDPKGLMTAPIEVQAQLPHRVGMRMKPPGCIAGSPKEEETMRVTMQRVKAHRKMLKEADEEYTTTRNSMIGMPLWRAMLSPAAILVQGMVEYGHFGEEVDKRWLVTLSNMVRQAQWLAPSITRSFPIHYAFDDSEDEEG